MDLVGPELYELFALEFAKRKKRKTFREKETLLITSNVSFSLNDFAKRKKRKTFREKETWLSDFHNIL